ncbi:hypothetical protein ACFWUU_40370 [Kribbella sp. NPDC058693]|uniref:hypothetical protein n=1 Tax=Kribbella sp. NPDC058693 TaxID=3346602 RepID=UPI00365A4C3C
MEKRMGPGRPPKGNRGPLINLKLPVDHQSVYEACAKELGLPLGDFVALCMAELFASRAQSAAEREHFAVPDYISAQILAHVKRAEQASMFEEPKEATRAA